MGNMIFNRRLGSEDEHKGDIEYRIFPQQMYGGPKGLGDPNFRGLTKMEEDPLIPQRMRDISRTQLCTDSVKKFTECGAREGFFVWLNCRAERDVMVACMQEWIEKPEFIAAVKEEYLNERSHFRETGIKQKRYQRGKFIHRDVEKDPPLDENGKYRPQKPAGWDESYPNGPPSWANFSYT